MAGTMRFRRAMVVMLSAVMAVWLSGCVTAGGTSRAEAAPEGSQAYSQAELDQMLAPIALYPDSLLSQVLMASTYPLEVVEAARWSRGHADYRGDAAVRAVEDRDWDPSVKSLVAFPRVLETMDSHLPWTESLGDAFLSEPKQVMKTIQKLRLKAYDAGTLRSNREIRVVLSGEYIYIEFASPDVVYVPYYDPTIVFGVWWWSNYPPMYWAPWPGYYVVSGFGWGVGTRVSTGFFFGGCDWRHGRVNVVNAHSFYYTPPPPNPAGVASSVNLPPGAWRHNAAHRRGVPYRNTRLRREFGGPGSPAGAQRPAPGYRTPAFQAPLSGSGTAVERRSVPGGGSGRFERDGSGTSTQGGGGSVSPSEQRRNAAPPQGGWRQQQTPPGQNQQRFQAPQSGWRPQGTPPAQHQQRFQAPPSGWRQQETPPAQNQQRFQAPPSGWRQQNTPQFTPPVQQAPAPADRYPSSGAGWRQEEGGFGSPQDGGQGGGWTGGGNGRGGNWNGRGR